MSAPEPAALDTLAARHSERSAVVWRDGEPVAWTYGELAGRVGGVAAALLERGVAPGDTVALVGGNAPPWVLLREAAGWLGLVFVPVGPRLAPAERDWLLQNAGARWVWGEPELRSGAVAVADWSWVLDVAPAPLPPRPAGQQSVALLYTSGSGGVPKGVLRPRDRDVVRIRQTVAAYGLRADDVHLIAGPLYHSGPALFYNVFRALGATQLLYRHFDAGRVAAELAAGEATALFMVPTMWRMLLEALDPAGPAPRLRVAWTAGSAMDPGTRHALVDALGEGVLWEFYGATETGTVAILPPECQRSHVESCGFPAPGVEVQVLDDDGAPLPAGEVGRVYVHSATTMLDYHRGPGSPPDLQAERRGDWLSVGDRGWFTDDGALCLAGREGGMVISGGINIYPEEVEGALRGLDGVREAVVFGVPDARWGQALAALVEPQPDAELAVDGLRAALRERVAGYKVPKHWTIATIPRTASQKVVRDPAVLAALLEG